MSAPLLPSCDTVGKSLPLSLTFLISQLGHSSLLRLLACLTGLLGGIQEVTAHKALYTQEGFPMLSLLCPGQSLAERTAKQAECSRYFSLTSWELSGVCPRCSYWDSNTPPSLLSTFQHPSSFPLCPCSQTMSLRETDLHFCTLNPSIARLLHS